MCLEDTDNFSSGYSHLSDAGNKQLQSQKPDGHAHTKNAITLLASNALIERFHRGRGLILLLAVATGFYMLKVPNWESLPLIK